MGLPLLSCFSPPSTPVEVRRFLLHCATAKAYVNQHAIPRARRQLTEAQTQTESEGPVVARPLHRVMERKVELLMLQSLPRLLDRAACEATSLLRDEQLGSVCNATFATLVYVGAKLQESAELRPVLDTVRAHLGVQFVLSAADDRTALRMGVDEELNRLYTSPKVRARLLREAFNDTQPNLDSAESSPLRPAREPPAGILGAQEAGQHSTSSTDAPVRPMLDSSNAPHQMAFTSAIAALRLPAQSPDCQPVPEILQGSPSTSTNAEKGSDCKPHQGPL